MFCFVWFSFFGCFFGFVSVSKSIHARDIVVCFLVLFFKGVVGYFMCCSFLCCFVVFLFSGGIQKCGCLWCFFVLFCLVWEMGLDFVDGSVSESPFVLLFGLKEGLIIVEMVFILKWMIVSGCFFVLGPFFPL